MAEEKTAVYGTYDDAKQAEQTIPAVLAAGFLRDAIAISKAKDGKIAGTQLTVHCVNSDEVTRAKDVLKQTGAKDISSSAEEPDQVFVES